MRDVFSRSEGEGLAIIEAANYGEASGVAGQPRQCRAVSDLSAAKPYKTNNINGLTDTSRAATPAPMTLVLTNRERSLLRTAVRRLLRDLDLAPDSLGAVSQMRRDELQEAASWLLILREARRARPGDRPARRG
jgi:hypothetical protein